MPVVRTGLLFALLATVTAPAAAQLRDPGDGSRQRLASNQMAATDATRGGTIMPYNEIIRRVSPQVGGMLIASDYQGETYTYRLRYMRSGSVVIVDVDARSAKVIRREGF